MNEFTRLAGLSLVALALAGCASLHQASDSANLAPVRAPLLIDQDDAYIAAVERIARRRGIEVVWVNVPTRRIADRDD